MRRTGLSLFNEFCNSLRKHLFLSHFISVELVQVTTYYTSKPMNLEKAATYDDALRIRRTVVSTYDAVAIVEVNTSICRLDHQVAIVKTKFILIGT